MLSKMRYLFIREGFSIAKVRKRMQNKDSLDEKMFQSAQKHINVKQKCDCKRGNHWFIGHFILNPSLMKRWTMRMFMKRTTQTTSMRKVFFMLFLVTMPLITKAQSMVTEISWNVYNQNYTGLLVLYPNNKGVLKVKTFITGTGWVWVQEDAVLTNQYDMWGNCTSYINCYNPKTNPYVPWAADNFIVYPNGAMYTLDASGTWSTQIVAYVVATHNWQNKFREYGIQR